MKSLSFIAVMLASATAIAADTVVQQEWWQALLQFLTQVAVPIIVPVVSTLVVVVLRRWNIKLQYEQVNDVAKKAAGWAEQKALKALKASGKPTPGAEKLKIALDFAQELSKKYGLSKKATEKLQDLIESAIGEEKIKDPSLVLFEEDPKSEE